MDVYSASGLVRTVQMQNAFLLLIEQNHAWFHQRAA